ncbi:uncharacterized protein LOC131670273 isoform X2 [Phymastichus coffea]|uniref:uncharacterized protein LOC131670273 isoform X2 n=1 Tax=Phymastichus coffea TaxID=108790 RepID=UPI00273A78BE|nr:uncharacterized protein LOC131670273 isoform X2 [Phymastichus coffea]
MSIAISNVTDNELLSNLNEDESLSSVILNNNTSSESASDINDDARINIREQLLHEQDDELASDEDCAEYEPIFQVNLNVRENPLEEMLYDDDANEALNVRVNITKAEIFLGVLKFSLVHKLSQSAIADLFKMLNIFFNNNILPQSRYSVNKVFNFENNIDYHALCPNCKGYVRQFHREQDPNARCDPCNLEFSVTDPTYRDFFCIINPEEEIRHYVEENWLYYQSVVDARADNAAHLNEFHNGLLYKRLRNSLPDDRKNQFVTATFNCDSSPVFESSNFSITF